MKIVSKVVSFVLVYSAVSFALGYEPAEALVYRGARDASVAVAVGKDMFIVADDENNILRVYKTTKGGLPLCSYDMTEFLGIEP